MYFLGGIHRDVFIITSSYNLVLTAGPGEITSEALVLRERCVVQSILSHPNLNIIIINTPLIL